MPAPRSHGLPGPTVCAGIVIAMLAMIVIPAAITLETVQHPAPLLPVDHGATPHGYAYSLLLFIFPSLVIGLWFIPREGLHIPRSRGASSTGAHLVSRSSSCCLSALFGKPHWPFPTIVGISSIDDGSVCERVVRVTYRRSLCLDRGYLCHSHCL
jgi:hypothetical protein